MRQIENLVPEPEDGSWLSAVPDQRRDGQQVVAAVDGARRIERWSNIRVPESFTASIDNPPLVTEWSGAVY